MNNLAKKRSVVSILITLVIISLLILSGPVTAVQVQVKRDKEIYNANDLVRFTASVDVESGERIPVRNLTLMIYDGVGQQVRNCTFSVAGSKLSSCLNIRNITVLASAGYGYATGLYGYGFGIGPFGQDTRNQTFYGFGYGYGFGLVPGKTGYNGELSYNITWNISAESSINDGSYSADLLAYASDGIGNYRIYSDSSPTTGDNTFTFDKNKPISSADNSPMYVNSGNISVHFTASDYSGISSVRLWYRHNAGNRTDSMLTKTLASSGTFSFQPTGGDGNYSFYTIATDSAGNVEDAPVSADRTTIYDETKPNSRARSVMYTRNGNITVNYSSSDSATGIRNITLQSKRNSGSWNFANFSTSSSGNFAFDANGEGNYSFRTLAGDNAGNTETKATADNLTIYDVTRPTSSANAQHLDTEGNITVNFTASDSGSRISQVVLYYSTNNGATWSSSGLTKTGTSGQFNFNPAAGTANYTFYTLATDNAGNVELSTGADTYTYYDGAAPSVSGMTSPSETVTASTATLTITTNENASCRYSTASGIAFVNISNSTETGWGLTHSWSLSGLSDGVKHYYIRCKDVYNHKASSDYDASFTVEIATTGGHGGGGGYTPPPSNIVGNKAQQWMVIAKGAATSMPVNVLNVAFTEIRFTVESESREASVLVKTFKEKPADVQDLGALIYQYLEINAYNLKDISSVDLDFKVPRSWLSQNNLEMDKISLFRNVNGKWVELTTSVAKYDQAFVYYTAHSAGFSFFAIGEKQALALAPTTAPQPEPVAPVAAVPPKVVSPPVVAVPQQEVQKTPAVSRLGKSIIDNIIIIVVIVGAVILLAAVLLFKVPMPRHIEEGKAYVKRARGHGKSDAEIEEVLRRHGWPKKDIERVLK